MKSEIIIKDFLGSIQLTVWFEECIISKDHGILPKGET